MSPARPASRPVSRPRSAPAGRRLTPCRPVTGLTPLEPLRPLRCSRTEVPPSQDFPGGGVSAAAGSSNCKSRRRFPAHSRAWSRGQGRTGPRAGAQRRKRRGRGGAGPGCGITAPASFPQRRGEAGGAPLAPHPSGPCRGERTPGPGFGATSLPGRPPAQLLGRRSARARVGERRAPAQAARLLNESPPRPGRRTPRLRASAAGPPPTSEPGSRPPPLGAALGRAGLCGPAVLLCVAVSRVPQELQGLCQTSRFWGQPLLGSKPEGVAE